MVETQQIRLRCDRVAVTLGAPRMDSVELLRTARILKGVYEDLRRVMWASARLQGASLAGSAVDKRLDGIEQELRFVLLDYFALPGSQLREHVAHALDQSLQ